MGAVLPNTTGWGWGPETDSGMREGLKKIDPEGLDQGRGRNRGIYKRNTQKLQVGASDAGSPYHKHSIPQHSICKGQWAPCAQEYKVSLELTDPSEALRLGAEWPHTFAQDMCIDLA